MDYSRLLLTIGNDKYESSSECQLKGAVNDSRRIGDYCRRTGWLVYSAENVKQDELQSFARQTSERITKATSFVVFHYSGHAEESEGQTWLIPLDAGPRVSLQALLDTLCKNVTGNTKLIVLIDGCRREGQDAVPAPIRPERNLARPQVLQFYACGSGRAAMEIEYEPGRWHGRFSLALLTCMDECDTLGSIIGEVQKKVEGFGFPRQVPCYAGNFDYSSVPNLFNPVKNREPKVEEVRKKCAEDARRHEKEVEGLKQKCHNVIEQLEEKRREVGELTSQKNNLEKEYEDLKKRKLELAESISCREGLLPLYQEEINRLEEKLDSTLENLRRTEKDLERAEIARASAEQECSSVQTQLESAKKRYQVAEDRRAKLQQAIDAQEETLQKCFLRQKEKENEICILRTKLWEKEMHRQ
eukprot:Skav214985  [mRNA]  locus=scaffold508:231269:232828:- [translate_table: standard]